MKASLHEYLFVAASLLLLASEASADPAKPSANANPIVVGAAIALSGPMESFDDGPYKAAQLAIQDINAKGGLLGRPLMLVVSDTKSDISYGATAAQNVIDKGASMVMVSCDYDYGSAAANIADSKGLIALSSCAGDPKFGPDGIGPNAYSLGMSAEGEASVLAEWAYSKGYKAAYILLQTDAAFDNSFADSFKTHWITLAGKAAFLGQDTFAGEDPQISTQITRLKSLSKAPDFIVVSSEPPPGVSAIKQLRAANVTQAIMGADAWDGDFWLKGVPNLSNMYFVTFASIYGTDPRPGMRSFFERYRAKFGELPTQSNAITGYSVIEAWSRAVDRAKSLNADKVRAVLDSFKDEPLFVGPTTFTPQVHINSGREMAIMEIQGGKQGKFIGMYAAHGASK